jgi:hypothetical protein
MALFTISAVGGWDGFTRGFFDAPPAAADFDFFVAGDDAATGAAISDVTTASDILINIL